MSKEPNEIPGDRMPDPFAAWRRLLQDPDALTEPGLTDKDAAWDKLFERLSERPRRRIIGYRIAAACLLVVLIPAARLFQPRAASHSSKLSIDKVRPAAPGPASAGGMAAQPAAGRPARSTAGDPTPMASGRLAAAGTGITPPSVQEAVRAISRIKTHPARIVTLPVAATPPPVIPIIAAPALIQSPKASPKKEWKVVDLNDIDPGHQRPHGMAANPRPQVLRLGPGSANAKAAESQEHEDDVRLKINLTTQNR
jgi:hypothetical protein